MHGIVYIPFEESIDEVRQKKERTRRTNRRFLEKIRKLRTDESK